MCQNQRRSRTYTISLFEVDVLALKVEALSFKYKNHNEYSLKNINLEIPQNSCTVILGPNGAGKSTLLSLISGLLDLPKEESGKIIHSGIKENVANLSYCTQHCALYDELSITENLLFFARLLNLQANAHEEIRKMIKTFDLSAYAHKRISHCSGGIRQRAHVAVSMLYAHPLIVLDEPFNNIDPESRDLIAKTLKEFLSEKKITIVISSHQFEAIEDLWTHLVFLKNGKVASFITKDSSDVKHKLRSLFEELK
jgi:ABC-2 type transport system ATP-binding protein